MDITLRAYAPADAEPTWRVFRDAIRGTAARYYDPEQIDAWCPDSYDAERWGARRASAWTVVAEADGRVVGFSDLRDGSLLDMLFVSPEAGGHGVARALVTAVLDEARRRGLARVVTHASRAARPAFERFGFVVDRENDANLVRGEIIPNYDMHRDLI